MKYPLLAPMLLVIAAFNILGGSLGWLAPPLAFGWGAPLSFFALNVVMLKNAGWKLSLPSALLLMGSLITLTTSTCKTFMAPESVEGMPVHELKQGLMTLGLSTKGAKEVLAARLSEALEAQGNLVCKAAGALPRLLCPLLTFSGPAILFAKIGPDPVIFTWLLSTATAVVPALPADVQSMVWQPGVVGSGLILMCSYYMMKTRFEPDPPKAKNA